LGTRLRISLFLSFFSILALAVLSVGPAFAQGTTGTLKGEIVDQAGSALGGVKLTVTGDNLQGQRDGGTSEDGRFMFIAIPPGNYRMVVEKEGFKTIIRDNLQISLGRTVSLKLVMELPEVGETIEVIDTRPVVDTESTRQAETLNHDFLKDLPSARSFQDVVQLLPGVTGGGNPNINGGAATSNQYYLDGATTTDPVTGTFSMNFNFDAIEDLEVITAGYDARYNQGLGGTINIVTKSGGNSFEGDFSFYTRTSRLQGDGNEYVTLRPADNLRLEANASLGGPIVKDRLWFFLSYRFLRTRNLPGGRSDIGRDFAQFPLVPRLWTSHYILAKLTAQPFARNKFTFSFRADPTKIENINQSIFTVPEAEQLWRQGGFSVNLSHEARLGGRAVLNTTVFYNYTTIFVEPMLWSDCTERDDVGACTQETDDQGNDLQSPRISSPLRGLTHGSWGNYNYNRRHRFEVNSNLRVSIDRALGSHTLDIGVLVDPIWSNFEFGYVGNTLLQKNPIDKNGDGLLEGPEEISDLDSYENAARYVIVNEEKQVQRGLLFNAYFQDTWSPTRGLTINAGARYLKAKLENNVGDTIIDSNAVSWGAGIAWDPFRDGKTSIALNFAQISDPGLLELSGQLNQDTFNFEYYPWDESQQRWSEEAARASTPASSISHPDFVVSRTNEFFGAIRREIARDMRAEVQFVYRRFHNLWEDDEVNVLWNEQGDDQVGFRNGTADNVYRLRTPQDVSRTYFGMTLLVRKQLSDNFSLLGSYTFSRFAANTSARNSGDRPGTSGDYDNPTQRYVEDGLGGFDRPHVLKISTTYNNPSVWKIAENFSMGYSLGGTFEFASGAPLNRLGYNHWRQGYTNYLFKRGTRERLPAYLDFDLRASLALSIAGTKIDIIVQMFNVLNSLEVTNASGVATVDNETVEFSRGGPVFASPTQYQQPRRFEVGVRFSF
jgi:hypothetical protein